MTTISKLLPYDDFYLWVLYEDTKPAAIASVNHIDKYKCSAIDHVFTGRNFRNKGYATLIIKHAVIMHSRISKNLLFLYAYREQAIRIYKRIGFVRLSDPRMNYWNAWLEK